MKLKEWRTEQGYTRPELCNIFTTLGVKVHSDTIARWEDENGRRPSREAMETLMAVTGGEVMPNDFYPSVAECIKLVNQRASKVTNV